MDTHSHHRRKKKKKLRVPLLYFLSNLEDLLFEPNRIKPRGVGSWLQTPGGSLVVGCGLLHADAAEGPRGECPQVLISAAFPGTNNRIPGVTSCPPNSKFKMFEGEEAGLQPGWPSKGWGELGPPAGCPFLPTFWGQGSPTKIDYRKKWLPLFEPLYWRAQQNFMIC